MTPAIIAQLIIAFGPQALIWIRELATIWGKDSLTKEEVLSFCDRAEKSYDQYIAEARGAFPTQ